MTVGTRLAVAETVWTSPCRSVQVRVKTVLLLITCVGAGLGVLSLPELMVVPEELTTVQEPAVTLEVDQVIVAVLPERILAVVSPLTSILSSAANTHW